MKKIQKITLLMFLLMTAFATASFAQECERQEVRFDSNRFATVTGKTGGCNLFIFVMDAGERLKVTLTSTDGKARFGFTAGEDTDSGYMTSSNLTTFDKVLDVGYFLIDVKGTASTAFTLKVTLSDE
jgi:hypothetical protein